LKYKRILLKISGEAFTGDTAFGVDKAACQRMAESIKEVVDAKAKVGIVVGGGNIFRGTQAKEFGFARTPADQIGMLGTMINGLVLQQCLSSIGCPAQVMSALACTSVMETYTWNRALQDLERGIVVIFVGGTGNPYFTTDTAGALRASEMNADVLFKATKVDGIYDKDPLQHPKAVKYDTLTYSEVLAKKLSIMDATAIALCRENRIPIYVFNLFEKGALLRAVLGKGTGSLVTGE
jgi:uridylate kinase